MRKLNLIAIDADLEILSRDQLKNISGGGGSDDTPGCGHCYGLPADPTTACIRMPSPGFGCRCPNNQQIPCV